MNKEVLNYTQNIGFGVLERRNERVSGGSVHKAKSNVICSIEFLACNTL